MRQTLLELTQDILLEMNSFDVNSISDTLEAEQVASIIRNTYYDIIQQRDWANTRSTIQLTAGTAARPTHMQVPSGVKKVEQVLYNRKTDVAAKDKYEKVTYLTPEQFLQKANSLDSTAANVSTVTDTGGISILIRTDKQPEYWTSFDDQYLVFDSYYSSLDSYLQNSKTQALVVKSPTWTHSDSFYPSLPEEAFPYLLAEAKSRAFLALKGVPNEKAEQASNRLRRIMSQKHWVLHNGDRVQVSGRKLPYSSRNPYLEK